MAKAETKAVFDKSKTKAAESFRAQVGALCYRVHHGDVEILLITSRDTGRWIIPKGWPIKGKKPHEAALTEAWEEAGVKGRARKKPLGVYTYRKGLGAGRSVTCAVSVYPVKVEKLASKFPEKGQRKRKWCSPRKAAERVAEPALKELLASFRPRKRERKAEAEAA